MTAFRGVFWAGVFEVAAIIVGFELGIFAYRALLLAWRAWSGE